MFKVGDLVKVRIRRCRLSQQINMATIRGQSDNFQGIILKTWTAYREPCRPPYINTIVYCLDGTEIEVPTWSMEPLRDTK